MYVCVGAGSLKSRLFRQRIAACLVILPGSVGLYLDYENEEYQVDAVYFTPKGLMYKGSRLSKRGERFEKVVMSAPSVDKILPVEGRSKCGYYDYDTGEIQESSQAC